MKQSFNQSNLLRSVLIGRKELQRHICEIYEIFLGYPGIQPLLCSRFLRPLLEAGILYLGDCDR